MVDGVNGDLDHVVRHVVVEYRTILECVTILSLHVEEKTVKDPAASILSKHVMTITAQVRFVYYITIIMTMYYVLAIYA